METLLAPPLGSALGLSSSCGCGSNVGLASATLADALLKAAQEISQAAKAFSMVTNNYYAEAHPNINSPSAEDHSDIANPQSAAISEDGTADGEQTESGSIETDTDNRPLLASLATLGNYSPTPVQSPGGDVDEIPRPKHSDTTKSTGARESNNKRYVMSPSPSTTELAPKVSTDHPTNSPFNTSHRINGGDQVHIGENTNTLAPPDFPVAPAREAATDPPELQLILPPTGPRNSDQVPLATASKPEQETLPSTKQSGEDHSSVAPTDNTVGEAPGNATSVNLDSNATPMPPGHYYIIIDDAKHAIALMGDLARRSKKTICGLPPDQSCEAIRNTLAQATGLHVTQSPTAGPNFTGQLAGIFLCPNEACYTHWKALRADCLISWGLAPNVRQYVYGCTLGEVTHAYMLLTRAQYRQMVKEHPISTRHLKQHPWSWRFNGSLDNSLYPGPEVEPTASAIPADTIAQHITPKPPALLSCTLPAGHYHIILDEPLDVVPLISYLALRSQRTICYSPVGNFGEPYRTLFNRVTGITTMYCDGGEVTKIKPAMQKFKQKPSAIILRPADGGWAVGFSKALADCVVYWGVPARMDEFRADCSLKATRSYVVITRSQCDGLLPRIPKSDRSFRHPSNSMFNDEEQGSVLHDLRRKTGAILAGMSSPPISRDEYKAVLDRRGIAVQMSV